MNGLGVLAKNMILVPRRLLGLRVRRFLQDRLTLSDSHFVSLMTECSDKPSLRNGLQVTMPGHNDNLTTQSHDEVVIAVRAYFAAMPAEELALLPRNCRSSEICDGQTIAELAYNVAEARSHLPLEPSSLSTVDDFLGRACIRLALLNAYAARLRIDDSHSAVNPP
jgi:hypothetical protein